MNILAAIGEEGGKESDFFQSFYFILSKNDI